MSKLIKIDNPPHAGAVPYLDGEEAAAAHLPDILEVNDAGLPTAARQGLQAAAQRCNVYTSTYIREGSMNLQVAKWGNSLALRLPADYARRLGLREGDQVEISLTADGGMSLRAARWDRAAFARELGQVRDAMPMTESVMDELRREARY